MRVANISVGLSVALITGSVGDARPLAVHAETSTDRTAQQTNLTLCVP